MEKTRIEPHAQNTASKNDAAGADPSNKELALALAACKAALESLRECEVPTSTSFGPAYASAQTRRQLALRKLQRAILAIEGPPRLERKVVRVREKLAQSSAGTR